MKFFYITDEQMDNRLAETIHIHEICTNLSDLGHDVRLYAPETATFHFDSTYDVVCIKKSGGLAPILFYPLLFLRLRRDISRDCPDIIYARHNHLLFVSAAVSRLCGVPLVLEVNGRLLEEARLVDESAIGRALLHLGILRFLESFIVRTAVKLIAVTPGIKEYLTEQYAIDPANVLVIPNGVDTNLFRPVERTIRPGEADGSRAPVSVGYIGSFYQWQGLRFIIEAARLVLRERPDAVFRIVGSGAEEVYLRTLVSEAGLERSIQILPAIPHDQVPAYLQALDICLCYPTRFRDNATSPFKVYEYLACGKAVVQADIVGMREEFGDAVAYAEPESSVALARVLVALIDDKEERVRLGKRGRAFVEHGRSWQAVCKKILSVCEQAILSRGALG